MGEMAFYLLKDGSLDAQHHAVYHFFDIPVLEGLLKRAGFLIQDAYYFDELIKFHDLSRSFERSKPGSKVSVCIVAQKPDMGEVKQSYAG